MRRSYALIALGSTIIIFSAAIAFAWTGPTGTPPNNNAAAPINVSSTGQTKNGYLGINETGTPVFPFEVNGSSLLSGSVVLNGSNLYLNFGGTGGSSGYGIRDNAGTMQYNNMSDTIGWRNFSAGTSQWTSGSGGLIYYGGGKVGIGTTTPTTELYVAQPGIVATFDRTQGAANMGLISLARQSDTKWQFGLLSSDAFGIFDTKNASTIDLTILKGGNVGIDNSSPSTTLEVGGLSTFDNSITVEGSIAARDSISSAKYCIGTSCITAWPTGGSGGSGGITNAGAAGYLAQITSASSIGNSALYQSGSSIGIGMTTPAYPLEVKGDIRADGMLHTTGNNGWTSDTWGGGLYMSDATWIRTYGSAGIWAGNANIGTNGGLTIGESGAAVPAGGAMFSNNIGTTGKNPITGYPTGWGGGVHTWDLYAEGTVGAGPSGGPASAYINSSGAGYLSSQLEVGNSTNNTNLNNNQLWTNTGGLYFQYSAPANSNVQIGNGTSEQDLDVPDGNMNIGGNVYMNGGGVITGLAGGMAMGGSVSQGWYTDSNSLGARITSNSGSVFFVQLTDKATNYMVAGPGVAGVYFPTGNILANGSVTASAFYYSSDERLKKDIEPMTGNLSTILALQPVTYLWKDPSRGAGEQIGFIAQQVQKVVPEIVHTDASTTLLSVDYSRITPILTGAVQELDQKITAQQQQIDEQQSEIDQLKSEIEALQGK